jgi:hypothetical protein
MKTKIVFGMVAALALAACGDDKGGNPDAKKAIDAAVNNPDAGPAAVPKIGAQIDRMGRPAVSTALNHSFDANNTTKQFAKDAYNAEADPTKWLMTKLSATVTTDVVLTQFEGNLGLIDSLDSSATASGCSSDVSKAGAGNAGVRQPLYNTDAVTGMGAAAYQNLAGALADDELYVFTGTGTCVLYLGVEGNFILTGGASAPTDCGGRTPTEDVIDVSYTALAVGLGPILANQFPGKDGIAADDAPAATKTDFPFLGAPH